MFVSFLFFEFPIIQPVQDDYSRLNIMAQSRQHPLLHYNEGKDMKGPFGCVAQLGRSNRRSSSGLGLAFD